MNRRLSFLVLVLGILIVAGAARAQGRFSLPAGDMLSTDGKNPTIKTMVEAKSHQMYFREEPKGGAPMQAGGEYTVTANKGAEIHARFKVTSLVVGGGDAKHAKMLGLDLKRGDGFTFTLRYESDRVYNLTIFDKSLSPVLSRNVTLQY